MTGLICPSCSLEISESDKFCGECGAIISSNMPDNNVQQRQANEKPVNVNSGQSEEPTAEARNSVSHGHSTKVATSPVPVIVIFGIGIVVAMIIWLTFMQSEDMVRQQPSTSSQTTTNQTEQPTSVISPNSAVQAFVAKAHQIYLESGIRAVASNQFTTNSCSECAPFIYYCNSKVANTTEVLNRKIRISTTESKQHVQSLGGKPVVLPFGEVLHALETGLIDCSVSGGHIPEGLAK